MAPDFKLADSDGRQVRFSDYRGKVVALNFWATWCGPCRIEVPWFNKLERRHANKGFAVIAISMDQEGWPAVKPFVSKLKVNYRVLLGNHQITEMYGGVDVLPTTFLIGRDGRIASAHVGLVDRKAFESSLEQLLEPVTDMLPPGARVP